MKFFGWLIMLIGVAVAVSGILMTGAAPGSQAADMDRLITKVILVIFGCGLGLGGCMFVVGAELRLWLSAIYDEVGPGETGRNEERAARPVRAEPVIL